MLALPSVDPVGRGVLIDWVTARVPLELLAAEAREAAALLGDRIVRYCPKTGNVRYESSAWDSVRSDSHQVAVRAGSDLWVQGSPARVIGDGCTVFGAGPAVALDLLGCVARMVRHVEARVGVALPGAEFWQVSRVDVTENLCLADLTQVKQALSVLRGTEGGRYKVSSQAGDTVYWSQKSKHRKGKAYAKGPHLRYMVKQKRYSGRSYAEEEILAADRLLRLELTLGREWFARINDPRAITPARLAEEWEKYFGRMLGDAEISDMAQDIEKRILGAAKTEGEGKAAFLCWLVIQERGWVQAQAMYTRRTWYRHLRVLRDAGFGDADISAGNVVPLRRVELHTTVVRSWPELLRAACA